jgi:hypothetical protein
LRRSMTYFRVETFCQIATPPNDLTRSNVWNIAGIEKLTGAAAGQRGPTPPVIITEGLRLRKEKEGAGL